MERYISNIKFRQDSKLEDNYIRQELKDLGDGERRTFTATFVEYGKKLNADYGYKEPIMLFADIKCEGNLVADHLWFNYLLVVVDLDLKHGDKVEFDARILSYEKGYKGYTEEPNWLHPDGMDIHFSHPTMIRKL